MVDFKGLYSFTNEEYTISSSFSIFIVILLEREELAFPSPKEFYFFYSHSCIHMGKIWKILFSCFKRNEGYFSFLILFSFLYFSELYIQTIGTTKNISLFFNPSFSTLYYIYVIDERLYVKRSRLGTGETLVLSKIYNRSLSIKLCNCVGWTYY